MVVTVFIFELWTKTCGCRDVCLLKLCNVIPHILEFKRMALENIPAKAFTRAEGLDNLKSKLPLVTPVPCAEA